MIDTRYELRLAAADLVERTCYAQGLETAITDTVAVAAVVALVNASNRRPQHLATTAVTGSTPLPAGETEGRARDQF